MIRLSDFSSLVKTFFKNIFSSRLPFEQQFKLFVSKAFETLFRVYVKRVTEGFLRSWFLLYFLSINMLRLHFLQRLTVFQGLLCIILSILLTCRNLISKDLKGMTIRQYIWRLMKTIWSAEEVKTHIWGWFQYIVELRKSAGTGTNLLTNTQ